MRYELKTNNNIGYNCHYHVVFCPKYRRIKYIKGASSRYLRQGFPQLKRKLPNLWTNSYFVATVGGVTLETLKRYVEGQKNR